MSKAEKLKMLTDELEAVKNNTAGTKCEVYARIVGYYRAVSNWNNGKAQEFKDRKMFDVA